MKIWFTKNKNYQTAVKRVQYDIPPQFISKIDFSYKIDESILNAQESKILYDKMRELTCEFRTKAMSLYNESLAREQEIVSSEINQIIEGFPHDNENPNDDPSFAAFIAYHNLRKKRLEIEIEQSLYFLEEERVESEPIRQQERAVTPTHVRSLGSNFAIQI